MLVKKSSYGINKRSGENSKFNWVDQSSLFSVHLEHISFFLFFSVLDFLPNKICINRATETWTGCYIGNSRTPLCNKL